MLLWLKPSVSPHCTWNNKAPQEVAAAPSPTPHRLLSHAISCALEHTKFILTSGLLPRLWPRLDHSL